MNQSEEQPYQPQFDRGNCGVGFVADQYGRASHEILQLGLATLTNLQHRGALNADAQTGDGAGVLTPLPREFFAREAQRLTGRSIDPQQIAVGVFFFDPHTTDQCLTIFEATLHEYELSLVTWRELPLDPDNLGAQARLMMPRILQAIITTQSSLTPDQFELKLYLARKHFERRTQAAKLNAYVPSMSSRTIVYKGLLLAPQLSYLLFGSRQSRLCRVTRRGASALQHQYFPDVAARAALSRAGAQWRDQHIAGQSRVDAGA